MSTGTPDHHARVPEPRAGWDRRHLFPGRPRAVNARFTDGEYAELAIAADLAGLTPTGFCAQAALDAARNLHTHTAGRVEHQALGSLQAELFLARVTVNQLRAELHHTRAACHQVPPDLEEAIANAACSLAGIDGVISRTHRKLAQRRPSDSDTVNPRPRSTQGGVE